MDKIETASSMVAKSTPPVTVSVVSVAGMPLQEWVYVATIVWILWQLACSIYDRNKRK